MIFLTSSATFPLLILFHRRSMYSITQKIILHCNSPASDRQRTIHAIRGVPSARGLGLVDLHFECSPVFPLLPRLMGIWQKWLGSWVRCWNTQIKVNPRADGSGTPCILQVCLSIFMLHQFANAKMNVPVRRSGRGPRASRRA